MISKITNSKSGLTLIEILLAVVLTTLAGASIYHSLSMGINVWKRSNQLNAEEDVAIFFDKLTMDLNNSFLFSQIKFEGNEFRIAFPTIVTTPADKRLNLGQDQYVQQIGKVEYFYDLMDDTIYRRQANYSEAVRERYGPKQTLVESVDNVKFRFYFLTDKEELSSSDILDVLPTGVEIKVEFMDQTGKHVLTKFIDIPIGS